MEIFNHVRGIIYKIRQDNRFNYYYDDKNEFPDFINNIDQLDRYRDILKEKLAEYEEWFENCNAVCNNTLINDYTGLKVKIHSNIQRLASDLAESYLKDCRDIKEEIKDVDEQIKCLESLEPKPAV